MTMIQNMQMISGTVGIMIAALSPVPRSTVSLMALDDGCPGVCTATFTYSQTSANPPCGTFSFLSVPPKNGHHEIPGCATCVPCTMDFSIAFYGGTSGCCMSYQGLDGGWAPPKGNHSRPGALIKNCNNVAVPGYGDFHLRVGDCATDPTTWTWDFDLTLLCDC